MLAHRIAVIAPSRWPVAEPFAGGLQAHVWTLTRALLDRGHRVSLFAAPGSDPDLMTAELAMDRLELSPAARNDVSMPPEVFMDEHHAYLSLMLQLARDADRYDVVHNHSLHHLPIALASLVDVPMVTTLHTPPTPWLESAVQAAPTVPMRFVAVSRHTATAWAPALGPVEVIPNGVDCRRWAAGPGGGAAVWSGRIVAEKAPHLAIDAAIRAGVPIDLAGPIVDPRYFHAQVAPRLGAGVRYLGHLDQRALAHLVRHASVAVVTPVWDEPYGLVVAEALACGTPVAAFARGGIPEIVDAHSARLAPGGNVGALAIAVVQARRLDRAAVRRRAESNCSVDVMIDRYEALLSDAAAA